MSGARLDTANVEATIDKLFGTGPAEQDDNDNAQGTTADADGSDTSAGAEGEGETTQGGGNDTLAGAGNTGQQDKPAQPKQNVRAAQNGDLIGPNGEVLARGGAERRYYETAQRATRELNNTKHRVSTLEAELNGYKSAAQLPTQLGLAPPEVMTAMQFMAHWKQNPVEAAKKMLAELSAAGYTLDELKGGVDVFAIKKMIEDSTAPFKQDREAEQRQRELEASVAREIDEVFTEFPWANAQQNEIAAVADQFPNAPLREVALRVEAWAYREGYDINQPLAAQVAARRNGKQPAATPNNARGPARTGAAPNTTPRRNVAADASRSNRDIVREAMREHGLNVE